MIVGIGCDLIEVERIACALERRRKAFYRRVFTEEEVAYSEARQDPALHLAARWAAKEAFFKALGTGLRGGSLHEVEVRNKPTGEPELLVWGRARKVMEKKHGKFVHISLSHVTGMAMAVVVIEGGGRGMRDER